MSTSTRGKKQAKKIYNENEYLVDYIFGKEIIKKNQNLKSSSIENEVVKYKIKWSGYDIKESTFEEEQNIRYKLFITLYEEYASRLNFLRFHFYLKEKSEKEVASNICSHNKSFSKIQSKLDFNEKDIKKTRKKSLKENKEDELFSRKLTKGKFQSKDKLRIRLLEYIPQESDDKVNKRIKDLSFEIEYIFASAINWKTSNKSYPFAIIEKFITNDDFFNFFEDKKFHLPFEFENDKNSIL